MLHIVADSEDPAGLIATALAACPPGSYLALTQPAADIDTQVAAEGTRRYNEQVTTVAPWALYSAHTAAAWWAAVPV